MNFCPFWTVCQLKVSRHTAISDARTEYDPTEDNRDPTDTQQGCLSNVTFYLQ